MSCNCGSCDTCSGTPLPIGPAGNDGAPGINGTNGQDGDQGVGTGYIITPEAPGSNCPCGGDKIEIGPSAANDGTPDSITNTIYLCDGCDGTDSTAPFDGTGGGIIMYDGDIADATLFLQFPDPDEGLGLNAMLGWAYCNGLNNTPDLRGRSIISTGQNQTPAAGDLNPTYLLGDVGGVNTHPLTSAQNGAHTHVLGLNTGAGTAHHHNSQLSAIVVVDPGAFGSVAVIGTAFPSSATTDESTHTHPVSGNTNSSGSGTRHETRSSFYSLHFIKKIS